jgi:hypothetical protein
VKDFPLIVRFAIAIPFHWSIHQWTRAAICPPKLSGSNQESALVSPESFRKVLGKKIEMAGLNALLHCSLAATRLAQPSGAKSS